MRLDEIRQAVEESVSEKLKEVALAHGEDPANIGIRAFQVSDRAYVYERDDGELLLHEGPNGVPMLYVNMQRWRNPIIERENGCEGFPCRMGLAMQIAAVNRLGLFVVFPDGKEGELIDFVYVASREDPAPVDGELPF